MKALLKISLITLALASPAFAGPSDGSGTNINLEKNDLTDNVKFHADFGDTQKQISSRKFKLAKDKNSIYDDVKPLIDRAESLYPGMGVMMEKAFDKTWLLVNTDYAGRNANEKKVISQ
ncbi:MAG: hypothetical protein ACXVBE_17700, partial [Bdellovibrionota bacterium]